MELVTREEGLWFVPLRQDRTTVQMHSVFVHKHFPAALRVQSNITEYKIRQSVSIGAPTTFAGSAEQSLH